MIGLHRLPLINTLVYQFRITDQRAVAAVLGGLRGDPRLIAAQPNYLYTLNGDRGAEAEAAQADAEPVQYVVAKLHLQRAHTLATGRGVLIAVVDTAIDTRHTELNGAVTGSFDAVKTTLLPLPHGTAMASAIVAHGRLMGVAPAARILAVRAFSETPAGAQGTTASLLDSLQWTATSGARVVNMSFAGPNDPQLRAIILALHRKGLVLVAAAGNGGPRAPAAYPAAYPEVIAVTATDADDHVLPDANHGRYISVAAPGVDILVAAPDDAYVLSTGTSIACAHVSGLVAMLLERNPNLPPDAIAGLLMRTARHLGPGALNDQFGAGLVDAYEAVLNEMPVTVKQTQIH